MLKNTTFGGCAIRALQVDHINGGGDNDRRGGFIYRAILRGDRDKPEFQLLCANYNAIKAFKEGENRVNSVRISNE